MLVQRLDRLGLMGRSAAALVACACAAACIATEPRLTHVSIELDDTLADQYAARGMLAARGMRATFFVNSARLDKPGYLTSSQLHELEADGHEIGGHTLDHPILPDLPAEEQRRQICADRAALLSMGFSVDNFAYPSGEYDDTTKAIAEECGYESARGTGGTCSSPSFLRDIFDSCDRAELIPPRDRFATRLDGSIRRKDIPDGVRRRVTDAELHGGGWVQLIFHHICDACDDYSITRSELAAFLDWLAEERDEGRVTVETVRDVIHGDS